MTDPLLAASRVVCLAQTQSTNDDAFDLLTRERDCLVWSLDQTAGRGSRGREWVAPGGHVLAVSLGFSGDLLPRPGQLCYPLLAGVVLYDVLQQLMASTCFALKWPNDVLMMDRKVAGILCESRWVRDVPRIVIGMGINLKRHPQLDALPKGYAALAEASNTPTAAELVESLRRLFPERLAALGTASALNNAWLARCGLPLGSALRLSAQGREHEGFFAGLDPEGSFLLRRKDTSIIPIRQTCDDFEVL